VADDKSTQDKALDLFVYAPVGAALYVRDMLPTMMNIFVARGKREVQSHLPGSGSAQAPPPAPETPNPADVRRKVEEGIGIARVAAESGVGVARGVAGGGIDIAKGLAGTALSGLGSMRPPSAPTSPDVPTPPRSSAPAPPKVSVPHAASTSGAPAATHADVPSAAPAAGRADAPPDVEALPIPDYDELSASQVVERLEGLDRDSLESIRRYETAHRGRNTILGKIAQLT
jgi:hypothetical protein